MDELRDNHRAEDLALVEDVLKGDLEAWHRFVNEKSGVVLAILRRYLFDDDEVRDVYVDVLTGLRRGKLAAYEGRSALTTWLVCLARGAAADHLRHKFGRRETPVGFEQLDPRQQEVYRLYHVEGLDFADVRLRLQQSGDLAAGESLAEILGEIESRLTSRTLRRIAWDLHATSVGAASGRLLEYLTVTREEADLRARTETPEQALEADHAERELARIRELIDDLPEEERRVLTLRYDEGWTAERIAEELDLPGRRRVYTIAERAVGRLRRWLGLAVLVTALTAYDHDGDGIRTGNTGVFSDHPSPEGVRKGNRGLALLTPPLPAISIKR